MQLDERKQMILKAIINKYVEVAEPISSRTILADYNLQVSSATIRNEMVILENLGYIKQPHISSGRIPSSPGYRYYVDYLMDYGVLDLSEKRLLIESIRDEFKRVNNYLKKIGSVVASLTNYTVFVTEEAEGNDRVNLIKLIGLLENKVLLIIVLTSKRTKDFLLNFTQVIKEEKLEHLSKLLTEAFKHKTLEFMTQELRNSIQNLFPELTELIKEIFKLVKDTLIKERDVELVVEGICNIFKQPEFNQVNIVESFLSTVEEKNLILNTLDNVLGAPPEGIDIRIGEEIGVDSLKDYALISTSYKFIGGISGKIGIIGPTRMSYKKSIQLLETTLEALGQREG